MPRIFKMSTQIFVYFSVKAQQTLEQSQYALLWGTATPVDVLQVSQVAP